MNLALAYYKSGWLSQAEDAKVIELLSPVEKQDQNDLAIAYMLGTALLRNRQMDLGQHISIASCGRAIPLRPACCSAPPS